MRSFFSVNSKATLGRFWRKVEDYTLHTLRHRVRNYRRIWSILKILNLKVLNSVGFIFCFNVSFHRFLSFNIWLKQNTLSQRKCLLISPKEILSKSVQQFEYEVKIVEISKLMYGDLTSQYIHIAPMNNLPLPAPSTNWSQLLFFYRVFYDYAYRFCLHN